MTMTFPTNQSISWGNQSQDIKIIISSILPGYNEKNVMFQSNSFNSLQRASTFLNSYPTTDIARG